MNDCGIYKIENTVNGNFYIGQSALLKDRKQKHWSQLRRGNHDNPYLQNSWNKYGEKNFIFSVLLFCEKSQLTYYEQKIVDTFSPEYNICRICVNSHLGIKRSEETKQRMSKSIKGKTLGSHRSEETKESISKKLTGRFISEETRKKLSIALKGIKRSDETKQKVRDANIGKKLPEEVKQKISKANTGKNNHFFGKKHSQESKKRMSQAQFDRHKREREMRNADN